MKWWIGLRILIYIKRIDKSLSRIADALELHAQEAKPKERRNPKLAEIYTPGVAEQNRLWRESQGYDD